MLINRALVLAVMLWASTLPAYAQFTGESTSTGCAIVDAQIKANPAAGIMLSNTAASTASKQANQYVATLSSAAACTGFKDRFLQAGQGSPFSANTQAQFIAILEQAQASHCINK